MSQKTIPLQTTQETKPKTYELFLGENTKVTTDERSKSKVISLPFEFPDETNAILIICRVKDEIWIPHKTIKKIIIEFT